MGISNLMPGTLFGTGTISENTNTGFQEVSTTTLGSAAQTVEFTGLDLETDKWYRIVAYITNNSGAVTQVFRAYLNSDATTTNYYTIVQDSDNGGTSQNYGNGNDLTLTHQAVNEDGIIIFDIIKVASCRPYFVAQSAMNSTTALLIQHASGYKTATTNVTAAGLASDQANGFKAGSRFTLYKVST